MKTKRLLITLVAFGAFTFGPGFAGEPSHPSREPASSSHPGREPAPTWNRLKTIGERSPRARHGSEGPGSPTSSQAKETKTTAKPHLGPKLPQTLHANGEHPGEKPPISAQSKGASGAAAELHQPGLNRSAGLVKAGSITHETENQRRLPVPGLPGSPPANHVVHGWVPAQAFIGGPTMWSAKNTAVIGGATMRHKF
jgi:hypothetical protein